jgi:hypothetical protein
MGESRTIEQRLAECRLIGHFITNSACWQCGGECFVDHDCGKDCCCCLDPQPNVRCDICEGKGGYDICLTCNPEADVYD